MGDISLNSPDERLRVSIDCLLEGVQVIGFDWTYLYLNETAARHGQRAASELRGRTMMDCYPGIEHTEMFAVLRGVMETRQPASVRNEFVYPNGQRRWFDLRIEAAPDGICVLSLDVTENRRMEMQLQQAQKLEAIGRLAGAITHDFNNQLTAMLGYTDLVLERIGEDQALREDLQEVRKACERSSGLTRQLLAFTRQQVLTIEPVSLNLVIRDFENLVRRIIGEDVIVEVRLAPDLWSVQADRCQLEQVLMNLVVNARDAMPAGGTLSIETANVELTEAYAESHLEARPGPHVMLVVGDTGTGMDAETQTHIFEPFFTTKDRGQGTGLGLACVYGIVKQLGGGIWVYSEPQRGTTFKLYFPACQAEAAARPAAEPRSVSLAGSETVLVVEDDAGVRSLVERILARHGYTVIAAKTGDEADELVTVRGAQPDLLLTDVVLPDVHGPILADRLQRRRALPVLFMSGYAASRELQGRPEDASRLIQKPFTGVELLRRVRAALDEP